MNEINRSNTRNEGNTDINDDKNNIYINNTTATMILIILIKTTMV